MNDRQRERNMLRRIADALLVFFSLQAADRLWLVLIREDFGNIASNLVKNLPLSACYALVMVLVYEIAGLYDLKRTRRFGTEAFRITVANLLSVLIVAAALFVFRLQDFSRGVLGLFWLLSTALVLLRRLVSRKLLANRREKGYSRRHVLLFGTGELGKQFLRSVSSNPEFGFAVDGYLGEEGALEGVSCLGPEDALTSILETSAAKELVAALDIGACHKLPGIIAAADAAGVKLTIIPYYNNLISSANTIEHIGESTLMNVRATPLEDPLKSAVKRAMDIVLSLIAIVLTSPIMLVAAIGVRLSSPGPIIFRQERVGLDKKPFLMYKFRSMRVNVEEDTGWTTDNDPRKTRFGSFLRKTSIDELPQFFNVLKGDMSVIGPRPEIPHFVNEFRKTIPLYMVKHRVRPGITGWAQVKGYRGDTSIEGRIRCDIWYIENWSLSLDIRILFLTVFGGMLNKEKLK
ncbi:MAG: undecaprenyl-phosphate glucose phosphotransferase [Clostridia bacterium]|nr:undecaprenyl-phosphate glucose phosphotransferase [Clostridia bacterium]